MTEDVLQRIAALAGSLGTTLRPVGHDALLRSITEVARRMFSAAACSIALLDDTGDYLDYTFAAGAGAEHAERLRIPASQGIAGWAVTTGQPIEVGDVTSDPRFARDAAEATGYVPRTVLAMPLEGTNGTIGVLSILDREESAGGPDMSLLSMFADQAAVAIQHAQVFGDLGRAVLLGIAGAADDPEVRAALESAAATAHEPPGELAELLAALSSLWEAGDRERQLATQGLVSFGNYARRRQ